MNKSARTSYDAAKKTREEDHAMGLWRGAPSEDKDTEVIHMEPGSTNVVASGRAHDVAVVCREVASMIRIQRCSPTHIIPVYSRGSIIITRINVSACGKGNFVFYDGPEVDYTLELPRHIVILPILGGDPDKLHDNVYIYTSFKTALSQLRAGETVGSFMRKYVGHMVPPDCMKLLSAAFDKHIAPHRPPSKKCAHCGHEKDAIQNKYF